MFGPGVSSITRHVPANAISVAQELAVEMPVLKLIRC
jgi:hypothetical protein